MTKETVFLSRLCPDYVPPKAQSLPFEVENVLCESPLPGGNEGIGFENWN